MGVIAKGEITLSNVNDAYTVSLTKTSCVINADYDGGNPQLGEAYTTISVKRGDKTQWFKVAVVSKTNDDIVISNASMPTDGTADTLFSSCIFRFDSVPSDALEGSATIRISTEDGYVADVVFSYTLVRESTMLDWIQEWEGNKTKIGDSSIVTPKIFVGKKITGEYTSIFDVPLLTGVYIGPSGEDGNSCGLYGYRAGEEIFHIDEAGALIGGWSIFSNGIVTSNENGSIGMYSDGTIQYLNTSGDVIWKLDNAGNATFGKGSVQIYANGDAEFSGKITSAEGQIGGWTIDDNGLASGSIRIDSKDKYVAISGATSIAETDDFLSTVIKNGGVVMQYKASNYGIKGCLPSSSAEANYCFSLGSDNFIAGWNFDADSLWSGTKNNTTGSVTTSGITIGSNGLRGVKWYIDNTGDISFMDGKIKFTASDNGGEIVGWKLNDKRFSADNIALVSDSSALGLYMSAHSDAAFNTRQSALIENFIKENSGVYLNTVSDNVVLAAYQSGELLFRIQTNDVSTIAGWNFDAGMLYTGTAANSGFAPSGSISIGPTGLRGAQWRLENDGSGALAGGKILWDTSGNVTLTSDVKIGWSNLGSTVIDSNGVFAGKISADNITAGTISTANITNASKTWYLNQDGSGALANGAIQWDADGNGILAGAFVNPIGDAYSALNRTVIYELGLGVSAILNVGSFDSSSVSESAPIRKIGSVTVISAHKTEPVTICGNFFVPNISSKSNRITSFGTIYKYFVLGPGAVITFDVYDDYNEQKRILRTSAPIGWFKVYNDIYPSSCIGTSYEELSEIAFYDNAIGDSMTGGIVYPVMSLPANTVQYMRLQILGDLSLSNDDGIYFQGDIGGTAITPYTVEDLKTETEIFPMNNIRLAYRKGGGFGFGIYYSGSYSIASSPMMRIKLYNRFGMIAYSLLYL